MRRDLIILCWALAVLGSCAHPRKAEYDTVRAQSEKHYASEEYQKALDLYRALHARYPKDPDSAVSYVYMVELIKKHSDRAYARGEYAAAYKTYQLLPEYHDDLSSYQVKLSFTKSFLEARIKSSHIKLAEDISRQNISSGDFQKAIDACDEINKKYRKDDQSRKCLVTAATEIGGKASAAYTKGEYAEAARIYALLRKNAKTFKNAGIPPTPEMRAIDARLANCCTILYKKGLELYRKGELHRALGIWKNTLEFNPDNAELKKAVATTTEQIKNLK